VIAEKKRNRIYNVLQNKFIDELADWLAGLVKGFKLKKSEDINPITFDK